MRFISHARTVSLITLVSRITGLVRDATLSRIFGASALMDAFFFAFLIPNLFRRLFGEGALSAAFLPIYTRLDRDDPEAARGLATLTMALLVVVLGGVVVIAEVVLYLLSLNADHEHLALRLMMVLLPYMPLVCSVAILGAMLQVHERFGPTAAAPIVLNLSMITAAVAGVFWLGGESEETAILHISLVAASVVVAGVLQVAWSLWALRKHVRWSRPGPGTGARMRGVLLLALPMIVGLGVLQLNTFFDGIIASYPSTIGPTIFGIDYPLQKGAMSAVSFAQRLYQFPLGVFGIAIATAIFPALARQSDNDDAFMETVRRGLRLVMFIGLPASVGLILVREPLVGVILKGGAFTDANTRVVGFVLLGYASAVWAYSANHVLTRAFYARGDARTPVKVAVAAVGLNIVLNCTLIWTPLREAGLAWSTAICAVGQMLALALLLSRRCGRVIDRSVRRGWLGAVLLTAAMGVVVYMVMAVLPDLRGWTGAFLELLAGVGTGIVVFGLTAWLIRSPELRWLSSRQRE